LPELKFDHIILLFIFLQLMPISVLLLPMTIILILQFLILHLFSIQLFINSWLELVWLRLRRLNWIVSADTGCLIFTCWRIIHDQFTQLYWKLTVFWRVSLPNTATARSDLRCLEFTQSYFHLFRYRRWYANFLFLLSTWIWLSAYILRRCGKILKKVTGSLWHFKAARRWSLCPQIVSPISNSR